MRIPLDRQSDIPLYKQIETFLRQGILSGNLAPDTRLPAIRQLARDLGINRITVEHAYARLEAEGLIVSRVGSGTYVLPSYTLPSIPQDTLAVSWPLWQQDLPDRDSVSSKNGADEISSPIRSPEPITFADGVGDPHLFPIKDFGKLIQTVLYREGIAALTYGEFNGYAPLRRTITQVLASQGLQTRPDNILITAGSQQALGLVVQFLLRPGDVILVENPTYTGALDLFRALDFKLVGIPLDEAGMQVEMLEALLQQHHPKLIYTIPNFHNPTGVCLSSQRRRQLITLAGRYNVPILEDDFVGDLRYDGYAQPALKALDPGGMVIYVSTFSKMLMPGLRVGFLVADGPIYDHLVDFKHLNDLATSNLIQRALEAYLSVGRYQAHLRRSRRVYRKRRDAMLLALKRHLPVSLHIVPPQGGLFIWLRLPDNLSSTELLRLSHQEGLTFAPGSNFFLDASEGEAYIRLNFARQPVANIEVGIKRLGKVIRRLAPPSL